MNLERNGQASKKGFPPFPLDNIYDHIVCRLRFELEAKIDSLANVIVVHLGEIDTSEDIETSAQADHSLGAILRDKKFFELVERMKNNFDKGHYQLVSNQ